MSLFEDLIFFTNDFFASYGIFGLFALAFAESIFFPIPPDLLLIAFSLTDPSSAFLFALIASIGSVLGSAVAYFLGNYFGEPLVLKFTKKENLEHVQKFYNEFGFYAVLAAGFSPIPFKVFALASGVLEMDLKKFILASAISRSARFFLIGGAIFFFGPRITDFLNNYFELITLAISLPLLLFISYKIYSHWKKKHSH